MTQELSISVTIALDSGQEAEFLLSVEYDKGYAATHIEPGEPSGLRILSAKWRDGGGILHGVTDDLRLWLVFTGDWERLEAAALDEVSEWKR